MSDDPPILVCVPTASLLVPVRGAVATACRDCRQLVWRAPSSFQLARPTILCLGCALARMRMATLRKQPVAFGGVLKGQVEELRRAIAEQE